MPEGFYESSFWYTELVLLIVSGALGCWLAGLYIEHKSNMYFETSPSSVGKWTGCVVLVLAACGAFGPLSKGCQWMCRGEGNNEFPKHAAIWGPARILKDLRPQIFVYFCELQCEMKALNTKMVEIEKEGEEMQSITGKNKAKDERKRLQAEYDALAAKSKEIEAKAGTIYFALFLSNLGVSYDNQDIDNTLKDLEEMLSNK